MTSASLAASLENELEWLRDVIEMAIRVRFGDDDEPHRVAEPPELLPESEYAQLLAEIGADTDLRLLIILALAPTLRPDVLDSLLVHDPAIDRRVAEFGGMVMPYAPGRPTIETGLFLLAGPSVEERLRVAHLVGRTQAVVTSNLLVLGEPMDGTPLSRPLNPGAGLLARLIGDNNPEIGSSLERFARRIDTPLDWDDLVVAPATLAGLNDIAHWLEHEDLIRSHSGLGRELSTGYRALFHGPPGTGKTLAASLLGARAKRDVYRVDLSMIVSKWIGETEKNLSRLFAEAEQHRWILFFDEADALFAKRTDVTTSNDRYANQEVSYLLQRIEVFDGVVVMAANLLSAMDSAFTRRFESIVQFRLPGPTERLRIWNKLFAGDEIVLADDVDLPSIAEQFDVSGRSMVNVVRTTLLRAAAAGQARVTHLEIEAAIRDELRNEIHVSQLAP